MFNLTGLISASFAMKESARSSETRHPDRENESHPTLDARVVRTARAEPCRCDCDIAQCIAQSREKHASPIPDSKWFARLAATPLCRPACLPTGVISDRRLEARRISVHSTLCFLCMTLMRNWHWT